MLKVWARDGDRALIWHRRFAVVCVCAGALLVGRLAWGDAFDPPAGYYSTATGSGATLKTQLHEIIDDHTLVSYDSARTNLQVTDDATPDNPNDDLILLVYDRVVLDVSALSGPPPGWDFGTSWDR